jgi:isoleucyl-tRNA synthetase
VAADLGGERVEIRQEDVSFATSLPEGFVLVDEGGIRFLLDARLDEELKKKGLVRELVHRIQNLRKEAGFEVTDRIALCYQGDPALEEILEKNVELVASEVLAVRMERGAAEGEFRSEVVLDEGRMGFGLTRVRGA